MPSFTVVIIGSGFGGQCAALELLRRGIDDFVILERRDFPGGTWRQNSYPGAAVDVQSPLYSIASEPYDWSRMFAEQHELEEYTTHVVTKHGLADRTVLGATVERIEWINHTWHISTSAGEFSAQFVVNATGPLSTPVIPPFPGRDTFAGDRFHTNEWDHDVDYRGKRVAIIGSGASAAQIIPAIQPDVASLHVFQRSPHWVMPRPDRTFRPWQRRLLKIGPVHRALRAAVYWKLETRIIGFKYSRAGLWLFAERHARKLLETQVADPELRAALTPDYTIGCKRIILSNTLYPAIAAPNTTLHDRNDGIAEITPSGITTTGGHRIDLDLIVFSTGYDATDGVISYPVIGQDGTTLRDVWADYPRAYLGTAVPRFPNLFIVTGPNTGIGHTSAIFVIEAQMRYIMDAITHTIGRGARSIEVTTEAEAEYTEMVHREMTRTVWKTGGCTSWYQSKSGRVIAMFPGFSFTYRRLASRFRRDHHRLRPVTSHERTAVA
ncbi:monooxygenase [Rhodococcus sp. Leaf7]|uniref:flavin-containing monooxygenase n=1 Tax=unclassified Rhodococcus (in: high G+C Gram-positive bacteria) TaxID=192944 RepID=UPI0006FE5273|nr:MULTISPECIES: NAD(P)/FAD-dependent oxidoreductase [unclassified Rhodococcus (in: high G+C Gram-positive bacteria)]KQU07767.1 monooxygenase [Rhodococcus sp. Leaf7]KQU43284.1 monooxygenase [Rhodococcus sp. Leaf247]